MSATAPPTRCPSARARSSTTTSRFPRRADQAPHRPPAPHLAQPSSDTVPDLWFHLYLNAFRNTRSTFWRNRADRSAAIAMDRTRLGLHRHHLAEARRRDRAHGAGFASSARTMAMPRTGRWRVSSCRSRSRRAAASPSTSRSRRSCPRVFARTGYVRDYLLVGQWFPKLGVYEPAGRRGRGGRRMELPPVPCALRVLRRLRPLPRRDDGAPRFVVGATGVRVVAHRSRQRDDDLRARAGGRPRLRLDGRSAVRRSAATVRRGPRGLGERRARDGASRSVARSRRCG